MQMKDLPFKYLIKILFSKATEIIAKTICIDEKQNPEMTQYRPNPEFTQNRANLELHQNSFYDLK
jgi:hypothetical protein